MTQTHGSRSVVTSLLELEGSSDSPRPFRRHGKARGTRRRSCGSVGVATLSTPEADVARLAGSDQTASRCRERGRPRHQRTPTYILLSGIRCTDCPTRTTPSAVPIPRDPTHVSKDTSDAPSPRSHHCRVSRNHHLLTSGLNSWIEVGRNDRLTRWYSSMPRLWKREETSLDRQSCQP